MIIRSNRHVNLHSKSFNNTRADQHGLVHVPAGQTVRVPDDVEEHPGFGMLVKDGTITIHGKRRKPPTDAEIQEARSQTQLKGEEPEVKPLEDEDPPLQTSSTSSNIPQAPSATPDATSQSTVPAPPPAAPEAQSLIPPAEEVDLDENEEGDEGDDEDEEETK